MKNKDLNNEEKPKKKKIGKKVLLGLLIIIGIIVLFFVIRSLYYNWNDNKIKNAISNLESERTDYVFVDINPSLVLTMRDNKVTDIGCLNDDCLTMFDDVNIIGKDIESSIRQVYDLSNEKGFNTSNGVEVRTTRNLTINLDYVIVEIIDNNKRDELLSKVKNNDNIKNSNEAYYNKLWKELKKDIDYGNVYECKMNNKEFECYILNSFRMSFKRIDQMPQYIPNYDALTRVLNKFDIQYTTFSGPIKGIIVSFIDNIAINGQKYNFELDELKVITTVVWDCGTQPYDKNGNDCINKDICPHCQSGGEEIKYTDGLTLYRKLANYYEYVSFYDVNLLNPNSVSIKRTK